MNSQILCPELLRKICDHCSERGHTKNSCQILARDMKRYQRKLKYENNNSDVPDDVAFFNKNEKHEKREKNSFAKSVATQSIFSSLACDSEDELEEGEIDETKPIIPKHVEVEIAEPVAHVAEIVPSKVAEWAKDAPVAKKFTWSMEDDEEDETW